MLTAVFCMVLSVTVPDTSRFAELRKEYQEILSDLTADEDFPGVVASVESGDRSFSWTGASGNLTAGSTFFIASTTKIFITALVLKLEQDGKLSLNDPVGKYLPSDILNGLHRMNGAEYSGYITIRHLLSHTSGIPDYFEGIRPDGTSLIEDLKQGRDRSWTFEDAVSWSKQQEPEFKPGEEGKALYSDTNFQLLGKIIESREHKPVAEVIDSLILMPLEMRNTRMYTKNSPTPDVGLNLGPEPLNIPLAMSSFGPDGGLISTSGDLMKFLRAFRNGYFFPRDNWAGLQVWNDIFFPLEAGTGITRFKLPWIFSLISPDLQLIGHSGLSGAFAFYCPEKDLFFTGTVNQVDSPGTSFRLMLKLAASY